MRHFSLMMSVYVCGAFVCCGGHGSIAADKPSPKDRDSIKTWGREVAGIQAAIYVDRSAPRFQAGESICLICRTRNTGHERVPGSVVDANPLETLKLTVVGPGDKREETPLTAFGKESLRMPIGGSVAVQKLEVGKDHEHRVDLNRRFDMTVSGKYEVVFSRAVLVPNSPPKTVSSTVLLIEITEPQLEE
ncbi:MAG: hypothetical protein NTZ32_26570 [Planctomycetales bacterium]|nr:hypothetical protein [Planctomycetales bacterium]